MTRARRRLLCQLIANIEPFGVMKPSVRLQEDRVVEGDTTFWSHVDPNQTVRNSGAGTKMEATNRGE